MQLGFGKVYDAGAGPRVNRSRLVDLEGASAKQQRLQGRFCNAMVPAASESEPTMVGHRVRPHPILMAHALLDGHHALHLIVRCDVSLRCVHHSGAAEPRNRQQLSLFQSP